jgi:hypothetical protein
MGFFRTLFFLASAACHILLFRQIPVIYFINIDNVARIIQFTLALSSGFFELVTRSSQNWSNLFLCQFGIGLNRFFDGYLYNHFLFLYRLIGMSLSSLLLSRHRRQESPFLTILEFMTDPSKFITGLNLSLAFKGRMAAA